MEGGSFEHIAWIKQRLGAGCVDIPVQGDRPLVLDDPTCAYIILSEHHQLFCVGYRDGLPFGRREHVATCQPGQLVVGVAPSQKAPSTLLLSGVTGSVVWRVRQDALAQLAESNDGPKILGRLYDSWVALLIESLPAGPLPSRTRALKPGDTLDEGQVLVRSDQGVCWIAPAKPPELYQRLAVGKVGVQPDCWPLGENAWALLPAAKGRVWSTAELLGADPTASFVQAFSTFVIMVADRKRAELARRRIERDLASQDAESGELSASLGKLARVGRAERLTRALSAGAGDASRALSVVHEGLRVPPPRHDLPDRARLSDMQALLAQATGPRSRPVLLQGDWWKSDAGPLLGFVMPEPAKADAPAKAPVDEPLRAIALLPGRGGYRTYDAQDGPARKVDAARAALIHPQAHQFYRPLPAGPVGPLALLRFLRVGGGSDVVVVAAVGLLVGLLGLLIPLVTGLVFDRIVPGAERGLLAQVVMVLLAVYFGSSLFDIAQGLALVRIQTRLDTGLEAAVWDRLLRLPLTFFRKYSAGELGARAAGIGSIREAVAGATLASILGGIFSFWNLLLLFVLDARLALAAAGLVLLATVVGAVASGYDLIRRRQLSALDGGVSGLLLQLVNAIAKLRVARAERRAFGVWANLVAKRRSSELGAERIGARLGIFNSVYPIACTGVLFYLLAGAGAAPGPGHVAAQALTTGQFLSFYSAFAALLSASLGLLGAGLNVVAAIPLYERAKPILTEPPEGEGTQGGRTELTGQVEVSHVSFRYQKDGPLVLDDVTLRIEPGEFVAIVGPSGSGKSTLLRLLLGFETSTEGGVYYDGQSLASLDVRAARQQIGVVLQNSDVMAGDIYSNIVGSTGRSLEEAWTAARHAAFDKDIEAMPMGMHTVLSQGKSTLSGGQRQRLLIARALCTAPKIMFFDEATSALDNQTQAIVGHSLDALRITRVVIAHRLSTIQHADKIVVMEGGRIVEVGGFDELLKRDGAFTALARRQML